MEFGLRQDIWNTIKDKVGALLTDQNENTRHNSLWFVYHCANGPLVDQIRAACHHLIEMRLQDPSSRVKQKAAEIIELMQKSKKRQIIALSGDIKEERDDGKRRKEEQKNDCPICFDSMEKRFLLNPCGHVFCESCAQKQKECSLCRKQVVGYLQIFDS